MNRAEYMKELAYLVQDVPDEEREEALQYYEDYFDDAGPENEAQVIAELGRPEKLAAIIREGARTGYESPDAEYTENGYQNERYRGPQYEIVPPDQVERKQIGDGSSPEYASGPYGREAGTGSGKQEENRRDPDGENWGERARSVFDELGQRISEGVEAGRRRMEESRERHRQEREERNNREEQNQEESEWSSSESDGFEQSREGSGYYRQYGPANVPARRRNPFLWILAVLGFLFLLPFLIGAAAVVFAISLVIICIAGGIALAVLILAVAFVVTGVVLFGVGIGKLFLFPLAGMMFMSVGLILLGLGILSVWLTVLICGKLIPGVVRMIANFFGFFGRRRGGAVS